MRRILVTGANKGIGLAIVGAILEQEQDTSVLLGSRDLERGRQACARLVEGHPSWAGRVEALELDVSRDASVAAAANKVREMFAAEATPLVGIVNNAGVGSGNLASMFEVNTLGMRRVCEAFLPVLDPSRGRIVNLTSAAGPSFVATCSEEKQRFFVDEGLEWPALDAFIQDCIATDGAEAFAAKGLGKGDSYGLSKACANSYTVMLARQHPHLRINACTPGFIETDMTRPFAVARGKTPADMGMKPPEAGTRAPMFLLFGEPEGNGRYYGSDAVRSPLDRYRGPGDPPFTG